MGFGLSPTYPHNILLELLAEMGWIGLLLVLLPFVRFPLSFVQGSSEVLHMRLGLLALSIFWLLNVQLSGDLVDSRYLWTFLLLLEIHTREQGAAASETSPRSRRARPPLGAVPFSRSLESR
jgi:O-antigen ligase